MHPSLDEKLRKIANGESDEAGGGPAGAGAEHTASISTPQLGRSQLRRQLPSSTALRSETPGNSPDTHQDRVEGGGEVSRAELQRLQETVNAMAASQRETHALLHQLLLRAGPGPGGGGGMRTATYEEPAGP